MNKKSIVVTKEPVSEPVSGPVSGPVTETKKSLLTPTEQLIGYGSSIIMFVFSVYYFKYLYKKFDKLTLILLIFFCITAIVLIPILVILYYIAKPIYKQSCGNSTKNVNCDAYTTLILKAKSKEALPYITYPFWIVSFVTFLIRIVKK